MENSEHVSAADEMAEVIATMGYALKMMMTLSSEELLPLLERSLSLTAKPTTDLDTHAALIISAPDPTTHSSRTSSSMKAEGKNVVIMPAVEQISTRQLGNLQEWMQRFAAAVAKPYIFVEGSAKLFSPPLTDPPYQSLVIQLFRMSQQTRVPLVGCVMRPTTTDLITLMKCTFPKEPTVEVSDAALLHAYMEYGQRTPVFYWELEGQEICFVYLKTNPEVRPARIEFPKWLFEAHQHEELFRHILSTSFLNVNFPLRFRRK